MTLLLNLVGPHGIHQSSDYRLTDVATHRPIEDEFGSKQLHHLASTWNAQISFTGFARIGRRKTRDWILESLRRAARSVDAATAMAELAATAAVELRRIPQKDWFLTIVATVLEKGRKARLFVVSCVESPGKAPIGQPLDHFEVHEFSTESPRELIFGCTHTVTQADRKFLAQLNRATRDQADIRRALAAINARSANRSNGAVSEGCLVTSTMPDGSSASENFGRTPGLTVDMAGSAEMLDLVTKAQKGKPTFIQSKGIRAEGVKQLTTETMNVSEGSTLVVKTVSDAELLFVTDGKGNTFRAAPKPPGAKAIDQDAEWEKLEEGTLAGPARGIAFSSTSGSFTFDGPDGSKYGSMEIAGMTGNAIVMKNRAVKITLGTASVHIFPSFEHQAQAMKTMWDIRSAPTIDGMQPHSWEYTVDMVLDASGGTISVRQNSAALRSANSTPPRSCLTESEELVVVSSIRPAVMNISKDQPSASAFVEARLFLRDIPKTTAATRQPSALRPNPRVGRNSPCPCGSGKKYKKCCLGRPGSPTS
jgi:hypothetical protein